MDQPTPAAGAQQPDDATAEHHTVDGARYLCHTDDHYCPAAGAQQPEPEERHRRYCDRILKAQEEFFQANPMGPDLIDVQADAAQAVADEEQRDLRAQILDYENRITWDTNCGEHARLLDSCRATEERAERAEAERDSLRAELGQARGAVAEMGQAIRLTREYVGEELLPAVEGWSWYDALRRHAPNELGAEQARGTTTPAEGEHNTTKEN